MNRAVFGIIKTEEDAQRIVDHLEEAGFPLSCISIIFADKRKTSGMGVYHPQETKGKNSEIGYEKHTKAPEGASAGATTGGIIGGSIGLLAGLGAISIPGLGPFIAAGPIMAALSGSAIGGSLGLLVGALVGMGVPEYEAKQYQGSLHAGKFLISIHTENAEELNKACAILKKEGAEDVSNTMEKTSAM
ncbi:MAG: hypothetical protein ACSNEK_03830 [Parachlamydiaceae bacterium]